LIKLTPEKTGTGAADLTIRIEGERFQRGSQATINGELIATNSVSSSALVAVAPEKFFKSAAELEVRVKNADENISNALMLSVGNGPLITRLSRKKIKAGSGDFDLTISGVAFKTGIVLLVNDTAVPTRFSSDSLLNARIPGSITGRKATLTLQARNQDGGRSNKATLKVVD
jgi:hypothetical protein